VFHRDLPYPHTLLDIRRRDLVAQPNDKLGVLLDVDDVLVTLRVSSTSPVLRVQSGRSSILGGLGSTRPSFGRSGLDDLGATGDLKGVFSLSLLYEKCRVHA